MLLNNKNRVIAKKTMNLVATNQKYHVMVCALNILTIIWLASWLLSHLVLLYPLYNDSIKKQSWIPFFFIGVTITWVVLSRVIKSSTRTFVFFLWAISLILMVSWGATSRVLGNGIVFGALTIACTFFTLSMSITGLHKFNKAFDTPVYYSVLSIVVAIVLFIFAPYLVPSENENKRNIFISISIFAVVIIIFQTWNTFEYLRRNNQVSTISNTCLFAVMAPWSETVDTFASLSRYN